MSSFSQLPMSGLMGAEKGHGSFGGPWKAHRLFDAEVEWRYYILTNGDIT